MRRDHDLHSISATFTYDGGHFFRGLSSPAEPHQPKPLPSPLASRSPFASGGSTACAEARARASAALADAGRLSQRGRALSEASVRESPYSQQITPIASLRPIAHAKQKATPPSPIGQCRLLPVGTPPAGARHTFVPITSPLAASAQAGGPAPRRALNFTSSCDSPCTDSPGLQPAAGAPLVAPVPRLAPTAPQMSGRAPFTAAAALAKVHEAERQLEAARIELSRASPFLGAQPTCEPAEGEASPPLTMARHFSLANAASSPLTPIAAAAAGLWTRVPNGECYPMTDETGRVDRAALTSKGLGGRALFSDFERAAVPQPLPKAEVVAEEAAAAAADIGPPKPAADVTTAAEAAALAEPLEQAELAAAAEVVAEARTVAEAALLGQPFPTVEDIATSSALLCDETMRSIAADLQVRRDIRDYISEIIFPTCTYVESAVSRRGSLYDGSAGTFCSSFPRASTSPSPRRPSSHRIRRQGGSRRWRASLLARPPTRPPTRPPSCPPSSASSRPASASGSPAMSPSPSPRGPSRPRPLTGRAAHGSSPVTRRSRRRRRLSRRRRRRRRPGRWRRSHRRAAAAGSASTCPPKPWARASSAATDFTRAKFGAEVEVSRDGAASCLL